MIISPVLWQEIVDHALADAPNECCGMIASSDGHAVRVIRATNAAASPLYYELDPREQLRIQNEIDDGGLDLGAIYHSHTRTAPKPSQTDIGFAANLPGIEWIIVGLTNADAPEVRSYLIEDGRVEEVALEVD